MLFGVNCGMGMGFPYEFSRNEESADSLHAARRVRRRAHIVNATTRGGLSIAVALRQARLARRYKLESRTALQPAVVTKPELASAHR